MWNMTAPIRIGMSLKQNVGVFRKAVLIQIQQSHHITGAPIYKVLFTYFKQCLL